MIAGYKVKFAVVGYGHIGKRHAQMITAHPEAELVALCDVRERATFGEVVHDVPFFEDLESMLNAVPEIDVVTICTPNGLHAEQCIKALEYRKHVVCEKPLALSKAACERVIYEALQVHRTVFGVMQNRYSPPSQWIKDLLEKHLLGEVHLVQVNCYWNRDARYYDKASWKGTTELDGGTLFTQFSHFIDTLYWLFGDIKEISGKFSNFEHKGLTEFEDTGVVQFRLANGGMGCLNYSTAVWDSNMESSLTIIGAKGSVKIGGQYMDKVEYCHIKDYTLPELAVTNAANDYGTYKGSANNHAYIIDNVVDTLKDRNTITTNALEGLKVVEIIERIYSKRNEQFVR